MPAETTSSCSAFHAGVWPLIADAARIYRIDATPDVINRRS
jgi:hypothetical protein